MKFSVEKGYNRKHDIKYIRKCVESVGYSLVSLKYENAASKLKIKCLNNHIFEATWNNFSGKHGSRCPICWKEKNRGENHYLYGSKGYWFGKKRPDIKEKLSKSLKVAMNRPETIAKRIGENGCNWRGGIKNEPYCAVWDDKQYKNDIKNRDSKTCQNCGITEMLSLKVYKQPLHLHHIDYNKKNCSPNNLITLCVSCNSKANYDTDFYLLFYQLLVEKKNIFEESYNAS